MDNIKLQDIIKAVNGKLLVEGKQKEFSKVVIDSRKVSKGDIFFAIKGENFDAHKFVDNVLENGAGLVIVHKEDEYKSLSEESSVILVEDTKKALLDLAGFYIDTLDIKVVGITGSTGKTSTKDLIAAALSEKYKVFKTKGNFNNDIGMPLMIFELNREYEVAILEMGMSNLGEIETLARIAKPDVAVITNIGTSHMENLKTRDNILKAKLEITTLFDENNILIVNGDNDKLHDLESNKYKIVKIGTESDYNFKGCRIIIDKDNIEFSVKENGKEIDQRIFVPVPGKHNVLNSLLAVAVARQLGVSYEEIAEGIKNLEATSMRLDVINHEGYTIINDAYNASPDSMIAALEVLKTYEGRKIAVLGTMKELGDESSKAHKEVAEYAKASKVNMLLTLGEFNSDFEAGFGCENFKAFDSIEDIVDYLKQNLKDGDVLLVKASRSMKFENIINELQKKSI